MKNYRKASKPAAQLGPDGVVPRKESCINEPPLPPGIAWLGCRCQTLHDMRCGILIHLCARVVARNKFAKMGHIERQRPSG